MHVFHRPAVKKGAGPALMLARLGRNGRRNGASPRGNASAAEQIASLEAQVAELQATLRAEREEFLEQQATLLDAEREVEISRERYASLYDYSPVGYVTLDEHGFMRESNLTLATMLGVQRNVLSNTLLARFVVPEERRRLLTHLRNCRRTLMPDPIVTDLRLQCATGCIHVQLVSTVGRSVRTKSGRCFHTAVLDVSVQKAAEEALKSFNAVLGRRVDERTEQLTDANRQLSAIVNTAVIGIITVNDRGSVESANEAAIKMLGYPWLDFAGTHIDQHLVPQPLPGEDAAAFMQLMGSGNQPRLREVTGRRKDGSTVILEASLADFSYGELVRRVITLNDISERKRLELELITAGDAERQRLGRDLHDGLGQHLHALYYMGDLLQKDLCSVSAKSAREAMSLTRHMEAAIELTRSLARGLQPVSPVPEGLMQALKDLAQRSRKMYRLGCRFECRAPVLVRQNTAANHLFRIAQEAVNNAIKHGKASRVRISLLTTENEITLSVVDNGLGIGAKPFSAKGLGLRTMRYRAEAIKGSVVIRPGVPRGTEVVCVVHQADSIVLH